MKKTIPCHGILLFLLLWSASLGAQVCGCADAGTCPVPISVNTSTQICYDITDAFNDDLADAAQGVCGVNLSFMHSFIYDVEMTLTSPDGTVVQLIGSNANIFFPPTNCAMWNIGFVPDGVVCEPDEIDGAVLPCNWVNDPNQMPWEICGQYSGSYYPFSGSLEDFDSGVVNGQWCLTVDNDPSGFVGELFEFEVVLCDNSGLFCCDAEAGNIEEELQVCIGDAALEALAPIPSFGNNQEVPDSIEYSFTYVISDGNGVILELDTLADLSGYGAGVYSVCGLSYLATDEANLLVPNGVLTRQDLEIDINGSTPSFCGDLSNGCLEVTVDTPPTPFAITENICEGDTLFIADTLFNIAGNYQIITSSSNACDSTINLTLNIILNDTIQLAETICEGEAFAVGDSLYSEAGNYFNEFTSTITGCDSLVYLNLEVLLPIETTLLDTICIGDDYMIGDSIFNEAGLYDIGFTSFQNCDSLVHLELTVLDLMADISIPDTITCTTTFVEINGSNSSMGTGITYEWQTNNGCIQSGVNNAVAEACSAGDYYLVVSQNGCEVRDTITVFDNINPPLVNAGLPDTLTCAIDSLQLSGSGSAVGNVIGYQWFTSDGDILSGADSPMPWVNQVGTYSLEITDILTGCRDTSTVDIIEINDLPFAEAGVDIELNCDVITDTLDGSASDQGVQFSYEWTNENGDILSTISTFETIVSDTGFYYFTVTNMNTGCTAIDSLLVSRDAELPFAQAGLPDTINCQDTQLVLDGSGSSTGSSFVFEWSTVGGSFVGDPDLSLTPTVDQAGLYIITVTNEFNNCIVADSVMISEDVDIPDVAAGAPVTLNCGLPEWELGDENNTSQGAGIIYRWVDSMGDTIATDMNLIVDEAGEYTFWVINTNTYCSNSETVQIDANFTQPNANAGTGGEIDCINTTFELMGELDNDIIETGTWYNISDALVANGETAFVNYPDTFFFVVQNGISLCYDTASVIVTADANLPVADAGVDQFLDCNTLAATLNASPPIGDYTYEWTSPNGGIFDTPTTDEDPMVSAAATYVFTVTDNQTQCVNTDTVFVSIDTLNCSPIAFAGSDGQIDCTNNPIDTLDATGTSMGSNITYTWTGLSGEPIFSGANTLMPGVGVGTYVLIVTNNDFNLVATDTVEVIENLTDPIADAGMPLVLDCPALNSGFTLDASNSSIGTDYLYEWSTDQGNFLSASNILNPTINFPGIYDLIVTDTTNGCIATSALLVTQNGATPMPCIIDAIQIPCGDTLTTIGDTCFSSHPDYTFAWTSVGGYFPNGDTTNPTPQIGVTANPADFFVTVVDTLSKCVAFDTVSVFSPTNCFPECIIATPDTITCNLPKVTIDASASSTGAEFLYEWTTTNGNICGDNTNLIIEVDQPGDYTLTIINSNTSFSCTSMISVYIDDFVPFISAGDDKAITCEVNTVELDGTIVDPQPHYDIEWMSGNNCFVNGNVSLNPEVDCDDLYILTVTNTLNGCTISDGVAVTFDTIAPVVIISSPDSINCENPTITLFANGSSQSPDMIYTWTFGAMTLATGNNLMTQIASAGGTYCLNITDTLSKCSADFCYEVFEDINLPFANILTANQVYTCADTLFTLEGDGSLGADFEYEWTTDIGCIITNPNQLTIDVNCAGEYYFAVTNTLNQCTVLDTVLIEDGTLPSVLADAGMDAFITCSNPSVQLDGSSSSQGNNIQYVWFDDSDVVISNNDIVTVNVAGLYTLVAQNTDNFCADTSTVLIAIDGGVPVADAGPDTLITCANAPLVIGTNNTSQGSNYSYEWVAINGGTIQGANNEQFLTISSTGTYTLQVTDANNDCVGTDIVNVSQDIAPPQAIINPEMPLVSCDVSVDTLVGALSQPVGNVSYIWTTPDGNITSNANGQSVLVNLGGTYQLLVENLTNGCQDSTTVVVEMDDDLPIVSIADADPFTCLRDSVLLDATGSSVGLDFVYEWTGPTGTNPTIINNGSQTPTVLEPLLYTLTITNTATGCSNFDFVNVGEDYDLPDAMASVAELIDCTNTEVTVSGEGSSEGNNILYNWTGSTGQPVNNPSALNPTVEQVGWYVLNVFNETSGCSTQDSVEVFANEAPITSIDYVITNPTCEGDKNGSIEILNVNGGTPEFVYAVDNQSFSTSAILQSLSEGNYTISVEDANGCNWEENIVIVGNLPIQVDLGPDIELAFGDSTMLQALVNIPEIEIDTVIWSPLPNADCPDCLVQDLYPLDEAYFEVTVIDMNGCQATDDIFIRLNKDILVYVPNAFSPNEDGTNDVVQVYGGDGVAIINLFQIFDRWGNLMHEAKDFKPNDINYGWDGTFEGKYMNPQVFVWKVNATLINGKNVWLKGDLVNMR